MNKEISITITGFTNKEDAIIWLQQYEGSVEQDFEDCSSLTNIKHYCQEMELFKNSDAKNFNLVLSPFDDEDDED